MHSLITQQAPTLIRTLFNLTPPNHRESRVTRHFIEPFSRKLYRMRTCIRVEIYEMCNIVCIVFFFNGRVKYLCERVARQQ